MFSKKINLNENEIPKTWYNIQADLPSPLPPVIHPAFGTPIQPDDLAPLFPMELVKQEVSQEREIEIPAPVREAYKIWRPTPFIRALQLEQALDTPARIYYKHEGVSPAGSHKPNTALAQAYYNKIEGTKKLTTETGAGQWGSSLAFAGQIFDLEVLVYMVKASFEQKPYRRSMMRTWGAEVLASPTDTTKAGIDILEASPDSPGSLGIAISEAVEVAAKDTNTKYSLGSVLNHVLLHQTVIGLETKKQLEKENIDPDIMIGCVGGGSNFAGLICPFIKDKLEGHNSARFIAVEPKAAPSLTQGQYIYDFGDTAGTTPLMKMYTLGHSFIPAPIHTGGLRYHGMAPIVCHLYDLGLIEAQSVHQIPVFQSALQFARTEGIIPAPESSHAIHVAIQEALKCKEEGVARNIIFELSGHGHFDLTAYDSYLDDKIVDTEFDKAELSDSLNLVPNIP